MKKLYPKILSLLLPVILFTTGIRAQCNNGTIPFTENFDAVTAPALPPCVVVENTNGDARAWVPFQGIFAGSTSPNIMTYTYNPSLAADDWFFIKGLTLTAGVSYAVTFKYLGTASRMEKLEVRAGSAPTGASAALGVQIFNKTDISAVGNGSGIFTPLTTGVYYFGFHVYSDANQNVVAVDNINVDLVPVLPSCTTNISPANAATNITIPPVLSWNAAANATSYDLFLGKDGITYNNIGNYSGTSAPVSGTAANTQYYWYVVPRNSAGTATGCQSGATRFTTTANVVANDSCGASILLSPGVPVNSTTINSTSSLPPVSCPAAAPTPTGDVWFRFNATYNGTATVSVTNPGGTFDAVIAVYSGTPTSACGGLTYVSCSDISGGGNAETINLNALTAGTTYYVRVYGYLVGNANTFTIQVVGSALPVTLTNLKGERNGTINKLSWTTLSEQNNKGFELQRSIDGGTFGTIGFINTKAVNGNSSAVIDYEFSDIKSFAGNNYYKLKQVDKDGRETYSNIVIIKGIKSTTLQLLSVYPNPSANNLNIVIGSPSNGEINLSITDISGKILMQQSRQVAVGDNNIPLSISKLAAGSYFIKLSCANGCESAISKFTKQ